jgi:hypothetical protein
VIFHFFTGAATFSWLKWQLNRKLETTSCRQAEGFGILMHSQQSGKISCDLISRLTLFEDCLKPVPDRHMTFIVLEGVRIFLKLSSNKKSALRMENRHCIPAL